ncbi:unnamed protein product [Lupinus luteus]|uniref:Uncharacterized protein n=1 Tax=Lupinus luteus TaxID=3873 RepID=A0AAV1X1H1_LUPLU
MEDANGIGNAQIFELGKSRSQTMQGESSRSSSLQIRHDEDGELKMYSSKSPDKFALRETKLLKNNPLHNFPHNSHPR